MDIEILKYLALSLSPVILIGGGVLLIKILRNTKSGQK